MQGFKCFPGREDSSDFSLKFCVFAFFFAILFTEFSKVTRS